MKDNKEMIKIVVDYGLNSIEFMEFVDVHLKSHPYSYYVEIVTKEKDTKFIEDENITVFPTIYVKYSTIKIEGYMDCVNYLVNTYP